MPRKTGAQGGAGARKTSYAKSVRAKSGGRKNQGSPLAAKKSLGQNFLRDTKVADAIVAAAQPTDLDTIIEIGPGPGILTDRLVAQGAHVIAVEIDRRFVAALKATYADHPRVEVVHADILETDPATLSAGNPYKVVANLPYYITSAILRHLLEAALPPQLIVLMLQKEVAQRICAEPGNLSILAVSVQYYAHPQLLLTVPGCAFMPPPKVDSAVIRLVPHAAPLFPGLDETHFFRIVRAGFSQKRKQLANSLSAAFALPKTAIVDWLEQAAIAPDRRAETLSLYEWAALARLPLPAQPQPAQPQSAQPQSAQPQSAQPPKPSAEPW